MIAARDRRGPSGGSWCVRRGSTRPWWRPTSAIRPISGSPQDAARVLAREAAKAAGWPGRARRASATARARSPAGCGGSTARSRARTGQGKPLALRLTGEAGELAARVGARGAPARRAPARARPRSRRARQAAAAAPARAARRAGREGLRADRPAPRGQEDHRPAGLDERPRRPADPQGQAAPADRVRLRHAARRAVREHPPRRARPDPARRHPDRLAQRDRAAARHRPPPRASSDCARARSRSTAASAPAPSPSTCRPETERCSSPAASRPAPARPTAGWRKFRVGAEGRISHLKRRYGLRRSRLKGHPGARTWTGLGDPGLQPRHARHPDRLTASRTVRDHPPGHHPNTRRPRHHPARPFRLSIHAVYPGQVASVSQARDPCYARGPVRAYASAARIQCSGGSGEAPSVER